MSHASCNYLAFIRACLELAAESSGIPEDKRTESDRVYVPAAVVLRDAARRARATTTPVTLH
jgi:hypothetical protein